MVKVLRCLCVFISVMTVFNLYSAFQMATAPTVLYILSLIAIILLSAIVYMGADDLCQVSREH